MNPSPPYFPVPLFVLLPTSFQSDWFLVLHVTLLLSTQVLQWPNLNYELWRGRICGWGRLVWRNAETGDFFGDGWWPDHNFEQTFANWLAATQPKSGHCSIWDTCAQEVLLSVLEGCTKPPIGCWPPRASGVLGALLPMSSMTSLCSAVGSRQERSLEGSVRQEKWEEARRSWATRVTRGAGSKTHPTSPSQAIWARATPIVGQLQSCISSGPITLGVAPPFFVPPNPTSF